MKTIAYRVAYEWLWIVGLALLCWTLNGLGQITDDQALLGFIVGYFVSVVTRITAWAWRVVTEH